MGQDKRLLKFAKTSEITLKVKVKSLQYEKGPVLLQKHNFGRVKDTTGKRVIMRDGIN